jgi:hypothetical protein
VIWFNSQCRLGDEEVTVMQRPDPEGRVRNLVSGMAALAVGFLLLWANWDRPDQIIIRGYSGDWRPWNRGDEIRVRLDLDRLRADGLSKEDVIKALMPSSMTGPAKHGVVFDRGFGRPEMYENIILKANAEGEIVRLKDVATLEVDP